MRRAHNRLVAGLSIFAFLFLACQKDTESGVTSGRADSAMVGTYNCSAPNDPNPPKDANTGQPAVEVWELQEGGKLIQTSPDKVVGNGERVEGKTVQGTWSGEGASGRVKSEFGDDPFKFEEGRLVFGDGEWVCTKLA